MILKTSHSRHRKPKNNKLDIEAFGIVEGGVESSGDDFRASSGDEDKDMDEENDEDNSEDETHT